MTLTLTVLRCPDAVPPETRRVNGGELRIGRGPDNDWIMPDPERMLSKRHCVIAFRRGGWSIADLSTNGTYLNRDADPIGSGQARDLRDGDRIRLGAYEIEARIAEALDYGAAGAFGGGASANNQFGNNPFGDDVFAPKPPPSNSFTSAAFGANDPLFGGAARPAPVTLPDDFDPLGGPDLDIFGPTQPDHTPSFSDAFRPPAARQVLPDEDEWDLSLPGPEPCRALPDPQLRNDGSGNPFSEAADFFQAGPAATQPPQAAELAAPPPAPADTENLLAAFLAGAGLHGAQPADPQAMMRALGATFRALVSGIRQAMIARSSIKSEFRIEQTMIRARGNNPLKFSADDDDALTALLGLGRRVDMGPDAAVADALRDMRLHELASMAAMQQAVRALLAQLDPASLQTEGVALLPAQKKARAFEAYEKLYEKVSRALTDDFDSVFGKSFARAYENALREISAREEPR